MLEKVSYSRLPYEGLSKNAVGVTGLRFWSGFNWYNIGGVDSESPGHETSDTIKRDMFIYLFVCLHCFSFVFRWVDLFSCPDVFWLFSLHLSLL